MRCGAKRPVADTRREDPLYPGQPAGTRFVLVRSRRKTLGIQITGPDEVTVRAPERMALKEIRRLLETRREWIDDHLRLAAERAAQADSVPSLDTEALNRLADRALAVIPARTGELAARVGVTYGRITIRNQRTRWGSCSSKGNLNFNCLLMLCPDSVLDYVIVHELCHRKEMNHSERFWAEVERVLPDYRRQRKWLKENGPALMARMR